MAVTAAISLSPRPPSAPTLQAVYTAGDTNKLTAVTCAAGIDSVLVYNRTGATLLIQTANGSQGASVDSSAAQLIQTGDRRIYAADVGCSPSGPWTFYLASAGSAVADLTARVL